VSAFSKSESFSKAAPVWSVMMPVYRPGREYFRLALESVLQQDEGPERMQIEVVDDCSPDMDVEAMVREIGGGRVAFSRTPKNLGLSGCWNTCIERARGKWVHLLHQDDLVLPGFYKALAKADANPEHVGAAFCRHAWCDAEGARNRSSELHCETAGILKNFMELIASGQRIQTPSVVVRRRVYGELGGFRSDLGYTLDWEMWQRIAARFPIWFEPEVLAVYRLHQGAETSRIRKSEGFGKEYLRFFEIVSAYHRGETWNAYEAGRKRYAVVAVQEARDLLVGGNWMAAFREMDLAARLGTSPEYWREFFSFIRLGLRVAFVSFKNSFSE
jgi:glycosyltransferase involved in cell wall biosynthesis